MVEGKSKAKDTSQKSKDEGVPVSNSANGEL
jgi:hypothetical protein